MSIATNLLKQYKTDKDKEENGIWIEFDNEISVRIRRISSQASLNARKEAEKPYTLKQRAGKLSDDVLEELAIQQIARGVIADWKGLKDNDGKDIPYSGDAAYEILKDPDLKEFRVDILVISQDRDNYKAEADKAALGN